MRRHVTSTPPNAADPVAHSAGASLTDRALPAARAMTRLDFLDGLRGIAALAVFMAHALDAALPAYQDVMGARFHMGQWGVVVFFLCSGFIIPVSLERQGSLRGFWIRRVFRLYPLYWLNMALCMVCALAGISLFARAIAGDPPGVFLANLTMFQAFLGYPYLNTVCWTLTAEMLFYISVSALFAARMTHATVPVTIGLLLATGALEALAPQVPGLIYLLPLAIIFVGTVLYRVVQGQVTRRAGAAVLALALGVLLIPLFEAPGVEAGLAWQIQWFTARLAAFGFFGAVLLLRGRPTSRAALALGKISYSLYLMHPLVIAVIPSTSSPALTVLVWTITLLLIATATYRWVEQPAIELGRRLTSDHRTGDRPVAPTTDH